LTPALVGWLMLGIVQQRAGGSKLGAGGWKLDAGDLLF
jgi:hypothetical protein